MAPIKVDYKFNATDLAIKKSISQLDLNEENMYSVYNFISTKDRHETTTKTKIFPEKTFCNKC